MPHPDRLGAASAAATDRSFIASGRSVAPQRDLPARSANTATDGLPFRCGLRFAPALALLAALHVGASVVQAQTPALSDYFGFEGLEVVKIDPNPGPVAIADVNGDGHNDLVVANNRKSRIEIHYLKPGASPDDEPERAAPQRGGVNEIPEHWRYRREVISVSHQVTGLAVTDVDGDGALDIVYAGNPPSVVFLRQSAPGVFETLRRHTVKGLNAGRDGFAIADVIGDDAPELIALVGGKVRIWPMTRPAAPGGAGAGNLGTPIDLAGGGTLVAFLLEDFNGDGLTDIVGVIPDDPAPMRFWLAGGSASRKSFGPQLRYEMPALREAAPIRLPGEAAARLGVIEGPSKRLVVYALRSEPVADTGDPAMQVYAFRDGNSRKRRSAVADVDGDGLADLVATDVDSNTVVLHRQEPGKGLGAGVAFPSYAEVTYMAAGNVDDDPSAEVFVLSEREGVVGRMDWDGESLSYPRALSVTAGHTPVVVGLVRLEDGPRVAVLAKESRSYVIELIDPATGEADRIDLGSQSRSPETIVGLDADQDGRTDLLLFTPDKPMTMLRAEAEGFKTLESKDMGQFGLVQAADSRNTEVFDIDGDGKPELLIADRNFIRAVRYEPTPAEGGSPGWQVVKQINADDPTSKLVSLAIRDDVIVAADRENSRLLSFVKKGDEWRQGEAVDVRGFTFNSIFAGEFAGDQEDNILAIGDDGFAVIRLAGERMGLEQTAAWRTDVERRLQHEMAAGDVNSDGLTDLVLLDAGEQMCEILSFSEAERLLYATGFQVFESKLFSGGDVREFQPREVHIGDVTGDGHPDIVLLCHDRLLIYPQMVQP